MIELAGLDQRLDVQGRRQDPRLEIDDRLTDRLREIGDVERGRRRPRQRRQPVVHHRSAHQRRAAQIVGRLEPRGIEQPGEIAEHRLAQATLGKDARFAGFHLLARFVIRQTIQQRGLKPLFRTPLLRHDPRRHRARSPRRSRA